MNKKLQDTVDKTLTELLGVVIDARKLRNEVISLEVKVQQLMKKLEAVLDSEKTPEPPKSGAQ